VSDAVDHGRARATPAGDVVAARHRRACLRGGALAVRGDAAVAHSEALVARCDAAVAHSEALVARGGALAVRGARAVADFLRGFVGLAGVQPVAPACGHPQHHGVAAAATPAQVRAALEARATQRRSCC